MMSLGTWGRRSGKYQRLLNLCNVFLLITSTILIFSSIVLIMFYHLTKLYFWSIQFYLCPLTMLALGLYTFLVCVYGIIISNKESRGLVSMVAVFLSVAFLGQVFSIYSAFDLRNTIMEPISNVDYKSNMELYLTDESVRSDWDWMQRDLRCCGGINFNNGFLDWRDIYENGSVPNSCCRDPDLRENCGAGVLNKRLSADLSDLQIWKDGCLAILDIKIENEVKPMLLYYSAVGTLLAIVELITVVLACAYVAQIGRRANRNKRWTHTANAANEEEYLPSLNARETNF